MYKKGTKIVLKSTKIRLKVQKSTKIVLKSTKKYLFLTSTKKYNKYIEKVLKSPEIVLEYVV